MKNNLNTVATYENPDIQKDQIYYENKGRQEFIAECVWKQANLMREVLPTYQ
jgi:hypothetical protein